jgi:hypothetical protein
VRACVCLRVRVRAHVRVSMCACARACVCARARVCACVRACVSLQVSTCCIFNVRNQNYSPETSVPVKNKYNKVKGGSLPTSHHRGLDSIPAQRVWDLW